MGKISVQDSYDSNTQLLKFILSLKITIWIAFNNNNNIVTQIHIFQRSVAQIYFSHNTK